jgi:hypothetical protein
MADEKLQAALTGQLAEIYGMAEGLKTAAVVIPGIMRDFQSMLGDLPKGGRAQEEYRTEDGRAVIILTGLKDSKGRTSVDGAMVNGKQL